MLRTLLAVLVCFLVAGAHAQEQSAAEKGMSWLQSAWSNVQQQAKPVAERAVRQFPERFKQIPKKVSDLSRKVTEGFADLNLEEKKSMIAELWRMRQYVNLMALLESDMLESLTGIDKKVFKQVIVQIQQLTKQLIPTVESVH